MLRSILSKRTYWYEAYKSHDYILLTFASNPYFMEAKLKHYFDITEFRDVDPQQLHQALGDLFLNKHTPLYLDALDKRLFNIKDLIRYTPEQRIAYLKRLSNKEDIKLPPPLHNNSSSDVDNVIEHSKQPLP